MAPSLSILIINWKSKGYLRSCLQSIQRECAGLAPQIVVVDGGSYDGCGEMLAHEFPAVVFVQATGNIGFGRSNNLGFEKVTRDTVLLLNPDTEIKAGAVQGLLTELHCRPDAGVIGPKLLNTDGSLQTSCVQALPTPLNQALDSDFLRRLLPNSQLWGVGAAFGSSAPCEVEAISGACMLLRTDVFRKIGGFSLQFFMYAEDMDLCARIRNSGMKVLYVPSSEITHHGGGSSRTQASQFGTIMMRAALATYMRIHHGASSALFYRILQGASALLRIMIVLPACALVAGPRQNHARITLKKWWHVLRWAAGASTPATT